MIGRQYLATVSLTGILKLEMPTLSAHSIFIYRFYTVNIFHQNGYIHQTGSLKDDEMSRWIGKRCTFLNIAVRLVLYRAINCFILCRFHSVSLLIAHII